MLRGLTAASDIAAAQSALREEAYTGALVVERTVGYPGGSNRIEIAWHPELHVWVHIDSLAEATLRDGRPTHYWNPIGLEDASPTNADLSVAVEVNPPIEGATARIAGLYGRESDGTLVLLHRGKIGGGKAGVGKDLFWQMFRGPRSFVSVGRVALWRYAHHYRAQPLGSDLYFFLTLDGRPMTKSGRASLFNRLRTRMFA